MSSSGLVYRTPADVRAIPNDQWERWLRDRSVPFRVFSADRWCQRVLRDVLDATRRRMAAEARR